MIISVIINYYHYCYQHHYLNNDYYYTILPSLMIITINYDYQQLITINPY